MLKRHPLSNYQSVSQIQLLIAAFCFILLAFLTFFVWTQRLNHLDVKVTTFLQAMTPLSMDEVFSFFSWIGNFEVLVTIATAIFIIRKKIKACLVSLFVLALGHGVELAGKLLIFHPQPPLALGRTHHLPFSLSFHSHLLSVISSFPSGHSLRVVFFGVLFITWLWQLPHKRWHLGIIFLVCGWIGLTLLTRITLGEHWWSDVLGGALLGLGLSLVAKVVIQNFERN
jgi:undecaprenyl-diphosphatase